MRSFRKPHILCQCCLSSLSRHPWVYSSRPLKSPLIRTRVGTGRSVANSGGIQLSKSWILFSSDRKSSPKVVYSATFKPSCVAMSLVPFVGFNSTNSGVDCLEIPLRVVGTSVRAHLTVLSCRFTRDTRRMPVVRWEWLLALRLHQWTEQAKTPCSLPQEETGNHAGRWDGEMRQAGRA